MPDNSKTASTGRPHAASRRAPDARTIAEIESQAQVLAGGEKWSEAARLLMQAARAEPDNVARWLQIAQWQRQNREPRAAARTLRDALRLNAPHKSKSPSRGSSATQNHRAREGDGGKDRDENEPRLNLDDLAAIWLALAETQLEAQAWNECIEACHSLLELVPGHHYARELLATTLLHAGRIDDAMSVMRDLLTLSPRDPLHRIKLATLLQLQGRSGEALREFQRVVASYPDAPFTEEAHEAVEALDRMQIQQILMRATEQDIFRLQLQRETEETLQETGFYLSEAGLESLRHLLWDGGLADAIIAAPPRIH